VELSIVRVTSPTARWALKAIAQNGEIRYRGYHYKSDAIDDREIWEESGVDLRNFHHNFFTAETLRIVDLTN
jgi:hypothetical protein